jgi:SAM-dependent methyltransferase
LPRNPKHPTLAPASLARPGHKFLSAGSASRVGHPSSRRGLSRAPNRRRRAANRLTGASIIHPAGKAGVMPKLSTTLHLDMLNDFTRANNRLPARLFRAIKHELTESPIYGLQWGDPETSDPLRFILDRYVRPYVKSDHTALEIGPGGGRWTRYLLDFSKVYAIDYHLELLRELQRNFRRQKNLEFVKNNGADFPGVPDKSIDFLFSFGALVHIELDIIQQYLYNIKRIVKPGANIVLQYSDKTKIMAQLNPGFSNNSPEEMRQAVRTAGYQILEEDLTTLWHSAVIRFTQRK